MRRITMSLALGLLLVSAATLSAVRVGAQEEHVVTDTNLNQKLATAKTPEDHEVIAEYYDREATENEKKAELHRVSKNVWYKGANQLHCSELIKAFQEAADQDKALATWHRRMAKKAAASP